MRSDSFLLEANAETWPLKRPFVISRGGMTAAHVIVATVSDGEAIGRGEAVPSRRYGQSIESVLAQLREVKSATRLTRDRLGDLLPAGAARNALDCALWDLEAKQSGRRVWELAQVSSVAEVKTSVTLSLGPPAAMRAEAELNSGYSLLKLKLGGDVQDVARVEAVRQAAPQARIIIDANESWSVEHYRKSVPRLKELGVALIEQPFPAADDAVLEELERPVALCADESCHTSADLPRVIGRYDAINIKLDKAGGFTEALSLIEHARKAKLTLLFGCMVSTSLAIAPARILAAPNDLVDLDGPLLLAKDRLHGLRYENAKLGLPSKELWG